MADLPFFDGSVLHDQAAAGVVGAVERHNLKLFLIDHQLERISHFARRITELGRSPSDTLIVVLQVDDPHGGALADVLMPGHDWQPTRDLGMVPYARGLATRQPIQEALTSTMPDAAKQLLAVDGVAVLAMDRGVVAAFGLAELGL